MGDMEKHGLFVIPWARVSQKLKPFLRIVYELKRRHVTIIKVNMTRPLTSLETTSHLLAETFALAHLMINEVISPHCLPR
jgi:hypothetical protein